MPPQIILTFFITCQKVGLITELLPCLLFEDLIEFYKQQYNLFSKTNLCFSDMNARCFVNRYVNTIETGFSILHSQVFKGPST